MLTATGQLQADGLDKCCLTGELSLDGSVRAVNGVLPMALRARADGKERMLVPRARHLAGGRRGTVRVPPAADLGSGGRHRHHGAPSAGDSADADGDGPGRPRGPDRREQRGESQRP
ncbi:MAG: hypothetical protein FJX74_20170 [Armatimonadetes bacterium]|nr:hypothetical protein [Armatimonadota bacterium]